MVQRVVVVVGVLGLALSAARAQSGPDKDAKPGKEEKPPGKDEKPPATDERSSTGQGQSAPVTPQPAAPAQKKAPVVVGDAEVVFVPDEVVEDTFWLEASSLCAVNVDPAAGKLALDSKELSAFKSWCGAGKPGPLASKKQAAAVYEKYSAALGCALWEDPKKRKAIELSPSEFQVIGDACAGKVETAQAVKIVSDFTREYAETLTPEPIAGPDKVVRPVGVTGTAPIATTGDIVVRAIAGFLEKRAKAEFRLFILKRLTNKLCGHDAKLKDWMPNTCAFIGESTDDAVLPLSLGPGFRSALVQDAVELPQRIVVEKLATGGAAALGLRVTLETARVIVQHRSAQVVGEMLEELGAADGKPHAFTCSGNENDQNECQRLLTALRQSGAVVRIVLAKGLHRMPVEQAIGVLAVEVKAAVNLDIDVAKVKAQVEELQRAAIKTEEALARLQEALSKADAGDKARRGAVLRAVGELADSVIALLVAGSAVAPQLAVDFAGAIEQVAAARDLVLAFVEADLPRIVALVVTRANGVVKIPGAVVRTVSFAVDLATTRSAEEAEAVIESVAAPVGAWQAKREDNWLSITGFVGLSYGVDRLRVSGQDVYSNGPAPLGALGIDLNFAGWPHPGARLGLFLSVIDVGQLFGVAADTKGEVEGSMGEDKDVEIERGTPLGFVQVFSPGIYVRLGLFDTPATVGVGVARVPEARTVTVIEPDDSRSDPNDVDVWRASAWIAMDVTLLPF